MVVPLVDLYRCDLMALTFDAGALLEHAVTAVAVGGALYGGIASRLKGLERNQDRIENSIDKLWEAVTQRPHNQRSAD